MPGHSKGFVSGPEEKADKDAVRDVRCFKCKPTVCACQVELHHHELAVPLSPVDNVPVAVFWH